MQFTGNLRNFWILFLNTSWCLFCWSSYYTLINMSFLKILCYSFECNLLIAYLTFLTLRGCVDRRSAGPVRWVGSPRWDDFYPTFIWNFLSQLNQKFVMPLEKDCLIKHFFTISSDIKPSCRTNVLIVFD